MTDPTSSQTTGYHIFIEPHDALAEELKGVISQLAQEYGGPEFPPHLTLLAEIPTQSEAELLEKARLLAEEASSFEIEFSSFGAEQMYFRTLYLRANENLILQVLHARANEIFGMQDSAEYVPHLSLLYGNYSESQKAKTIESLSLLPKSLIATTLSLYQTEGEVHAWRKCGEFSFRI